MRTAFGLLMLAMVSLGGCSTDVLGPTPDDPRVPAGRAPTPKGQAYGSATVTIRNGHGVELGRFEGNLNRFSNAQLVDWDMSEADSLEAIVLMWHMLVNPAVGSDSGAIMITYMGGDTSEVRVNQRNVSKSFLASDWRLSFEDEYLRTDLQTPDTVRLALRTDNSLLLQMDVATEDLPDLRTTQYLTSPASGSRNSIVRCSGACLLEPSPLRGAR